MTSKVQPSIPTSSKSSSTSSSSSSSNLLLKDETAIFQHNPDEHSTLRKEWEPGCQPDEVYDKYLPAWRAWLRRYLVTRLRGEKDWMAAWHRRIRTEGKDKYFYWTALFGTHTFFMTFLPIFFFFGFPFKGRGMLYVVGLGVYVSSFAKDLVCTPRPYSPPVLRLSMSTHHHEYGFPSSHSTNSVSIALFLGEWLFEARETVGWTAVIAGWSFLTVYVGSVVGGRLYTGMHSIADVVGGSLMGVACWAFWVALGRSSEAWVGTGTWAVPITMIPLTLAMVHYHPEPVDDCPCFEDAIAILSVILGSFIGHWLSIKYAQLSPYTDSLFSHGITTAIGIAIYRLVIGLGIMFLWRLVIKAVLLRALPPMFRLFSKVFDTALPTRRFYKAATDYGQVPPSKGFHPVPSVMDLHLSGTFGSSNSDSPTLSPHLAPAQSQNGRRSPSPLPSSAINLRSRRKPQQAPVESLQNGKGDEVKPLYETKAHRRRRDKEERAKYDAEVLTKVGVYSGIGLLATTLIPAMFVTIERYILG